MTTFIDTNVIIYLQDGTSSFHKWAKETVSKRREAGPILMSDIVYSELSVAMTTVADTDMVVKSFAIERLRFSNAALFKAGKAFDVYRKAGGPKLNVLSDFLIGAQAEAESIPLITNNARDFASYFPKIVLINPPVIP